ncbi:hypothetical protein AB0H30_30925 [Streptomyces pseudogriseolus]|uniref:hypothetical protein n=1 Tax=Streptomyces pseudogriseolus TaxID=36817 RepID=UPI00346E2D75
MSGFRLAIDTEMSQGRRIGRRGQLAAHPQTGFREEHVPAFLHDDWSALHLACFPGIPLWQLRRSAAVRLARRARRGSLIDAAQFLGLSTGIPARSNNVLDHRLKDKGLALTFEAALDNLAIELRSHPIDYAHRRRTLDEWAIPPAIWDTQIVHSGLTRSCEFAADDCKRLACSAYVWARITHGEHLFAPTPAEIRDDADKSADPAPTPAVDSPTCSIAPWAVTVRTNSSTHFAPPNRRSTFTPPAWNPTAPERGMFAIPKNRPQPRPAHHHP